MGYSAKGYIDPLSSGTHACSLEIPAQQQFHSHAHLWNGCVVSWWHWATHLSENIHVFCRLSREVSSAISACFSLWLIVFRVLLATIWDQGLCPCLCCLVPDTKLDQLGLVADMKTQIQKYCVYPTDAVKKAWDTIYNFADPVNSTTVQRLLKGTSTVPTSVSHQSFHWDHLERKIIVND